MKGDFIMKNKLQKIFTTAIATLGTVSVAVGVTHADNVQNNS